MKKTEKYINNVKSYLKEKYGKINKEWSPALALLEDNFELYEKCKESIQKDGVLLVAKNGSMTKNPSLKVMFDAQVQITKILSEFGATPKSASKLLDSTEEINDITKLFE